MGVEGARPSRIDRRSQWRTLTPNRTLPADERPDGYALEIVTGGKGNPRGFARDFGHAWLRLISSDGGVRSVGFFPDESTNVSPERPPGRRMPGMLLHPDKYDGLRYPTRVTRLALTVEQFDSVVDYLEGMQADRADGSLGFGLVDRSCVWFLTDVAAHVGIEIDATYDLIQAAVDLLPERFGRRLPSQLRRHRVSANPLARAGWRLYDLTFNAGLYVLGGRRVVAMEWVDDDQGDGHGEHPRAVLRRVKNLRAIFSSISDVFGPVVPFFHVRALIGWQDRRSN